MSPCDAKPTCELCSGGEFARVKVLLPVQCYRNCIPARLQAVSGAVMIEERKGP